ncbi:MAG TPA: DUF4198 domain-containing protein [Ramlibacter sp.]|nr:DUF4198 domain-containing protein [Ramlibacter sp.]
MSARQRRFVVAAAMAACLMAAAAPAAAHDSWLGVSLDAPGLRTSLALATGQRFPIAQSGLPPSSVADSACIDGAGQRLALTPDTPTDTALLLTVTGAPVGALSCWAQTQPHEVQLTPQLVEVYLREIQPPPEVRAAWQSLRQQGAVWRERYVKHARVERLSAEALSPQSITALRSPTGAALEMVISGAEPVRVGSPLRVRVLRDGAPLAGQAVELVSERSPLGIWQRSDERGEVAYTLPFGGRWLLRATRVTPPNAPDGLWQGLFSTLLLEP